MVLQNESGYPYWCDYENFGKTIGNYICSSQTVSVFSKDDLDKLDIFARNNMELTN